MNFSSENDALQEHIRSQFYKVGSYRKTSTKKITSKSFLHSWYFDLYDTMYANGIKIGSIYFLSIFLQYVKNELTLLNQELQKLSTHEYHESLNFLIDTQVSVRYLDYLLDHNYDTLVIREEIDGLKHDMDLNNKYSIPFEKEERTIHFETIKLLESYLDDDDREKKQYLAMNTYINELDLQEVKDHILSLTLDDEQKDLCLGAADIKRVKNKIVENIDRFNKAFQIDQSYKSSSILLTKEKSFTSELFIEAIKKGFTVEFFFACFANENSRSKLKTRALSDKPKYARIKEFAHVYYELTKGKKSTLSYISLMIFGLEAGLNTNTIYKLTNQFYSYDSKNELNRNEFYQNLQLFSSKATSRHQLDTYIDDLSESGFKENPYVLSSDDEDYLDSIYKEFHSFIVFYMVSNNMDLDDNNLFIDDKVIDIDEYRIGIIMNQFKKEELHKVYDVVLTEEEIDRIKKL